MSILRIVNRVRDIREAQLCRRHFDAAFYLDQNPDVARQGVDPLQHFVRWGWRAGRDPNPDFSLSAYIETTPTYHPSNGNPLVHAILTGGYRRIPDGLADCGAVRLPARDLAPDLVSDLAPDQDHAPAPAGAPAAPPAPLDPDRPAARDSGLPIRMPSDDDLALVEGAMDTGWYQDRYPEVEQGQLSPAAHYLTVGWLMGYDPSPNFSTRFYVEANPDLRQHRGLNPYVHFLRHGQYEPSRAWTDVAGVDTLRRFLDGPLAEDLARAVALDPMVALPEGRRHPNSPLIHSVAARTAVRRLRQRFAGQRFDYVITIPHVRMSGAARVAGQFAAALARLRPDARIMVVLTDLTDLEHPEWFPEGCEIVKLAAFWRDHIPDTARIAVLMDLIYGVEARAVININSRLFWDALTAYGRQLSQEIAVGTYLFTWEETRRGNRVGYPVQWLRDCTGYLDAIACDAGHLAADVRERFGFDGADAGLVHTLRTPMDGAGAPFRPRAAYGARRILWAGRFDRQKRPDILRQIALDCPDIAFDVYGRAVLDHGLEDALRGIPNLRLMGEYEDFDAVTAAGYGLFLYTAQWDGMPTIVLDAIRAGLPVIAPDVGGLGEVIGPDTGWLIGAPDDVRGYTAAIDQALSDPGLARARAEAAFSKAQAMFAEGPYDAAVAAFVQQLDEAADDRA